MWPPVALAVPLLAGVVITATAGDPFSLPRNAARLVGLLLCVAFGVWNGWTLVVMASSRTSILPGGATRAVIMRGPFRHSRNPLYVGLIVLYVGIALLWPSVWALLLIPGGIAFLIWGAIVPEEKYLSAKFGADYEAYRSRVRRWL